jgi:hypothetical protein
VTLWNALAVARSGLGAAASRLVVLVLGAAVPFIVLALVFQAQGVLQRFAFWTFTYAREYVRELPLASAFPMLAGAFRKVTASALPLWLLAGLGLGVLWLARRSPAERVYITGLLIVSFLAVCPGFYFREHYFILLLPAVALLLGVAADWVRRRTGGLALAAGSFALVAAVPIFRERDLLFTADARAVSRAVYGENPFIESIEIARFIRDRTTPRDRIAVLGSEPQIYFYSNRRSATGYIYTYALMEPQPYASRMQDEMVREIEAGAPRYLVFVKIRPSWLIRRESDRRVLHWADRYLRQCFDLVGVADVDPERTTQYRWEDAARAYEPASDHLIYVFRRKSDAPCTVGAKG